MDHENTFPTLDDEIDYGLHAISLEFDRLLAVLNQQARRGAE